MILAWATPFICLALMALVATAAHLWIDPLALAALGGFTVALLAVALGLCLNVLVNEEIFIDRRSMLVRRRLGKRVWERALELALDARAHVGADTRLKAGRGSYTAIRLRTASGNDYFFGGGLNTRDQDELASQINAYFGRTTLSK